MKNRGITLIALIITIIVLLILSAVVINLTIGEKGLFSTAKYATKQYKMAETREKIALAIVDMQAEYVSNDKEFTMDTVVNELPNKVKDLTIEKNGEEAKGTCDKFKYKIDKDYNVIIEGLDESTGGSGSGGSQGGEEQPTEPEKPEEDPNAKYWEYKLLSDDTYQIISVKGEYENILAELEELKLPEKYNEKKVTKVKLDYGLLENRTWKTKKLYIPSTIEELLGGVPNILWCMPDLQEFIVDEENEYYESKDGYIMLKGYPTLSYYPRGRTGSFNIPSTVKYIDSHAFTNSLLSNITIPNSVVRLNGYNFYRCSNLRTITIPSSIEYIPTSAFEECTNLETVYFNHTTSLSFQTKCFYKTSGVKTTFYFKNATIKNAFTTAYYNPTYGTLSTNYNW